MFYRPFLWIFATGLLRSTQTVAMAVKSEEDPLGEYFAGVKQRYLSFSEENFNARCSNCTVQYASAGTAYGTMSGRDFDSSEVVSSILKVQPADAIKFLDHLLKRFREHIFFGYRITKNAGEDECLMDNTGQDWSVPRASIKLTVDCDNCAVFGRAEVNNGCISATLTIQMKLSDILSIVGKVSDLLKGSLNLNYGRVERKARVNKRDSGGGQSPELSPVKEKILKCSNCIVMSASVVNNGILIAKPNIRVRPEFIAEEDSERVRDDDASTAGTNHVGSDGATDGEIPLVECKHCAIFFFSVINNGATNVRPTIVLPSIYRILKIISPRIHRMLNAILSAVNLSASSSPGEHTVWIIIDKHGIVKFDRSYAKWGEPQKRTIGCERCTIFLATVVNHGQINVKSGIEYKSAVSENMALQPNVTLSTCYE